MSFEELVDWADEEAQTLYSPPKLRIVRKEFQSSTSIIYKRMNF